MNELHSLGYFGAVYDILIKAYYIVNISTSSFFLSPLEL